MGTESLIQTSCKSRDLSRAPFFNIFDEYCVHRLLDVGYFIACLSIATPSIILKKNEINRIWDVNM